MIGRVALRDVLNDDQMADEIGAPVALVHWARAKDPSIEPPALDPAYDLALQEGIVNNVRRLYSHWGLLDGTCPF